MARIRRHVTLLAGLLLASADVILGQVATGTPPFGSFGGGPDIINLANLNSHITVPVINKAGRGLPFSYNLSYDTSVWYLVGVSGSGSWQHVANWGWRAQTEVATGYVSYTSGLHTCNIGTRYDPFYVNWTKYTFTAYHDSFGVSHPFFLQVVSDNTTCPASFSYPTDVIGTTSDGSGYTMDVSGGPASATVYPPSGGNIDPPLNSGFGNATATDSNGNYITVSGSVFTDTLGTTALTVSGTAPNPVTFTYTSPAGTSVSVTLNYTTKTVQTNFGCTGIVEYGPTSVSLVTSISMPDGTSYGITYEPTPGSPANVTGRIASVSLPTGGTISYQYTGGSGGITCADGTAATLTRSTPDGTWIYAHSESGTAWTTAITDPQQNQTVLYFQGIYETERDVKQGSTTLLATAFTCYNGATAPCNTTAITLPITRRTVTKQLPDSSGKVSKTDTFYNSLGLVTEGDEYDYASGAPGPLVRKTLITYAFLDRPATITVQDGSGSTKAQTTLSYDQTAVTATSGTPQHLGVFGSRGNPTTVTYLVQGPTTTLSRTFAYYDTGTVQTATDVNGTSTTYTYGTGSCGNSFVTSVSLPLGLSRSMAWNCTGGVMTSSTDENNQTTTFTYNDPYFWRINSLTDPASNVANFTYTGATASESSLVFNGSSSTVDVLRTLDGLGRIHTTQQRQAPSASNYDSVETDYDSLGRPSRVTLPYSGTAGQTNASGPGVTTTYDPLGRATQVADSGGGSVTLSYTQNDVLRTVGPAPTGENTKRQQFESDALGRLTSVCEITGASGSGTCAQTASATGYWTQYTYDVLGNLTGVTQNAQSGTTQSRSYTYDRLARMTSESNPETATTTYVYDSDPTCGTSSGDLVKRVDAVGNTACYAYDALHRVTSITYYSGPYAASTPNKYFVYDSATVNSVVMANAKGRVAEAYTATCPTCAKITDVGLSYTARGQVSDVYQSTPHSGVYYHVSATYWAHGALNQLSGLPGLPTLTYTPDGEGRPAIVSASTGQNPVLSTTYNVASQPTQVNLGSSDSDSFSYDANTARMTQYSYSVNAQSVVGNLGWNANSTLASLNITDPFNGANTQNCSFSHDDLTRIQSVNCGSVWSQTFSYDAFGNINKSGSMSFQPTYSPTTNRMTSLPGFTPSYDANGNVLNDSFHMYAWDAESRPATIDSVGLTFDALGRMVEQNLSGAYTQIVYAPTGAKLALMSGQTLQKAFVPLPAGAAAVYNASGLSYYRHPDWLGSSRFASTPTGTMYSDVAYAPFGEPYAQAGTQDFSFTGQNQDTVGGSYDFLFREYATQGRWPSPDPAGLAAVDLTDPQSLNRYSYALNNPCIYTDPLGLDRDVVKTFSQTFNCNGSASQVIAALKSNFASFANYSTGEGYTVFSPGAITLGQTILIDSRLQGGILSGVTSTTSAVQVSSISQNSFTFETVQGQHPFYPGTITFSGSDAGQGRIRFSVNVNANFPGGLAGLKSRVGFFFGGQQFEENIWTNLINNIADFCQKLHPNNSPGRRSGGGGGGGGGGAKGGDLGGYDSFSNYLVQCVYGWGEDGSYYSYCYFVRYGGGGGGGGKGGGLRTW